MLTEAAGTKTTRMEQMVLATLRVPLDCEDRIIDTEWRRLENESVA